MYRNPHAPNSPSQRPAQDAIGYERTQAFQLVMAVVKALLVILFSVHVARQRGCGGLDGFGNVLATRIGDGDMG